MNLFCPNCKNLLKGKKTPKGFVFAESKCPFCWCRLIVRDGYLLAQIEKSRDISIEQNLPFVESFQGEYSFEPINAKIDMEVLIRKIPKEYQKIIRLYLRGNSFEDIGKMFGVSKQAIQQKLRRLGRKYEHLL